jgi:preprotein translocase subunit SecF
VSFSFQDFGNDLYTGKRSIPVVSKRRAFYLVSAVVMVLAIAGLALRGLNLSLEFRGGSEFRVADTSLTQGYETRARDAVRSVQSGTDVNVTKLGTGTIRVQTERLNDAESAKVKDALSSSFQVPGAKVSATFIGPSWGASVSQKALQALVIFLLLTALVMAIYFRNWKMALAALIALAHDMVITVGLYAIVGLEVSPATMIGFLTVLGYSLYDTVVVFDKVRENTAEAFANGRMSFADAANLAVNQTMVRSINTTVIAVLPILAVLAVGLIWLGPGTLLDLALVLFLGIVVGAYSSIFLATPLLVTLRAKDEAVLELDKRAARHQAKRAKLDAAQPSAPAAPAAESSGAPGEWPAGTAEGSEGSVEGALTGGGSEGTDEAARATVTGRAVHKYAQGGPRNQPKRTPKSKR